jgi:signal transduction histidine kinase
MERRAAPPTQRLDPVTLDPATHRRHLQDATQLARDSLTEARRSVQALGPGSLEHARLPVVLREHVDGVTARHALLADTQVDDVQSALPAEVEIALLRVAQEALANVVEHAEASRVGVTMSLLDDRVLLDVRDDGRGSGPEEVKVAGFGGTSIVSASRLADGPDRGSAGMRFVPCPVQSSWPDVVRW